MTVNVCFTGAQPTPLDAAGSCALDDHCPGGQYCSTMSACTLDCRTSDDCPRDEACDDRGRCQPGPGTPADDGGCCGTSTAPQAAPLGMLVLVAVARRRRRAIRSPG